MNIQHEILAFYTNSGSIEVKYFCDEVPEGLIYTIDVPIENGQFVSQESIEALIENFKPIGQLQRIADIKSMTSSTSISAVVIEPKTIDKQSVIRAERTRLLFESDWTQMPDVDLSSEVKGLWLSYRQALRDITTQSNFPDSVLWPLAPNLEPR